MVPYRGKHPIKQFILNKHMRDLDIRFGLFVVQMATHITSKCIKAKRLGQNGKP